MCPEEEVHLHKSFERAVDVVRWEIVFARVFCDWLPKKEKEALSLCTLYVWIHSTKMNKGMSNDDMKELYALFKQVTPWNQNVQGWWILYKP